MKLGKVVFVLFMSLALFSCSKDRVRAVDLEKINEKMNARDLAEGQGSDGQRGAAKGPGSANGAGVAKQQGSADPQGLANTQTSADPQGLANTQTSADQQGSANTQTSANPQDSADQQSSSAQSSPNTTWGTYEFPEQVVNVDIDLTKLSATVVYAQVFDMLIMPEEFDGLTVRMRGTNYKAFDEEDQKNFYYCVITDATACCAQGVGYRLADSYAEPADYPSADEEIVVRGVFRLYKRHGYDSFRLDDAVLERL